MEYQADGMSVRMTIEREGEKERRAKGKGRQRRERTSFVITSSREKETTDRSFLP